MPNIKNGDNDNAKWYGPCGKSNTHLTTWLSNPTSSIYPREVKAYVQTKTVGERLQQYYT